MKVQRCNIGCDIECHLSLGFHRIKMGVCEGFPNSIQPDEDGRADYHGERMCRWEAIG